MKHIYTHKDFDDLVTEFLSREQQLMQWKTGEYASEKDRLLNFHQEGLKQRIADSRNYLLLLAACLDEEERENEHSAM